MQKDITQDKISTKARAVLVGVCTSKLEESAAVTEQKVAQGLDELEELLTTLNIETCEKITQKRLKPSPSHLVGSGKVEEIKHLVEYYKASYVVFDQQLSGPQMRNLEKDIPCEILDRTGVILDIFARHAKTKQAKTQVEIAKLEYLLPRLTGAWTHFQRQTGGGVHARGMGEKQIEVDRRRARERISKLQKQLEQIKKEKQIQSKRRESEIKISLVGYTNSGKTTIMRRLSTATLDGKNELFATLETTVRTLDPNSRPKILLSDTVGFIDNLPHGLIESFRSTLEEVKNSDLLLHVVDLSHKHYLTHMQTTQTVLKEIGAEDIPQIIVFNKVDLVDEVFLAKILKKNYPGSITISAFNPEHIKTLRNHIFEYFRSIFKKIKINIPFHDQEKLNFIHKLCIIEKQEVNDEDSYAFEIRAPEYLLKKLDHTFKS